MSECVPEHVVDAVQQWLNRVVIGLNLCPFAAEPNRNGSVTIQVSMAETEEALLIDIQGALRFLDRTSPDKVETVLLVAPGMLADFEDYCMFLSLVDMLLEQFGWEGAYQVASFHPQYYFAGTHPEDVENLTNRSPYPIFHILREASVSRVLASYSDPDQIPKRNIETMRQLRAEQQQQLFPYLFN